MILCLNLNAAIDKTIVVSSFEINKIHRPESVLALAGGKAPPEEQLRALPGVREVRLNQGTIALIASHAHVTIPALLVALGERASDLSHLATHEATLEDLFVTLTGRHLRDD